MIDQVSKRKLKVFLGKSSNKLGHGFESLLVFSALPYQGFVVLVWFDILQLLTLRLLPNRTSGYSKGGLSGGQIAGIVVGSVVGESHYTFSSTDAAPEYLMDLLCNAIQNGELSMNTGQLTMTQESCINL